MVSYNFKRYLKRDGVGDENAGFRKPYPAELNEQALFCLWQEI
jgi:hypothetical protein